MKLFWVFYVALDPVVVFLAITVWLKLDADLQELIST